MKSWAKAARAASSTTAPSTPGDSIGDVRADGVVEKDGFLLDQADLAAGSRGSRREYPSPSTVIDRP